MHMYVFLLQQRMHARMSKHREIDEAVLIWFKHGVTMNGPVVKTKATALAREMSIFDWEASDGWLYRFKHPDPASLVKKLATQTT